ncbi:MAG TPA: hemerythrin domain-containing protein [Burkholderiales bacterium]|nr:hemerythrin domain-containing protein [Burkholderiales bacterium]
MNNDNTRTALDALDLLMQDHRELEWLFREFEHRQQKHQDLTGVIANVCAELRIHDTLATEIFYPAVEAHTDEAVERLVSAAEEEHDTILELVEEVEKAHADDRRRNAHFMRVIQHVKQRVLKAETELFPLVKQFGAIDLEAVAVAMTVRKAELMAEMPA